MLRNESGYGPYVPATRVSMVEKWELIVRQPAALNTRTSATHSSLVVSVNKGSTTRQRGPTYLNVVFQLSDLRRLRPQCVVPARLPPPTTIKLTPSVSHTPHSQQATTVCAAGGSCGAVFPVQAQAKRTS